MCMFGHINCGCHQKYKEKKCISDITNHLCMQHFAVYFLFGAMALTNHHQQKKKLTILSVSRYFEHHWRFLK